MDISQIHIAQSAQETQKIGQELADSVIKGDPSVPKIVCFYGTLGAGKTTCIQGMAKGLGLPSRLVSPTFIIVKRYTLGRNFQSLYHIDLYRIQKDSDIKNLGLAEIFNEKNSVSVIEWAERLGTLLPEKRIDVHMEITSGNERKIRIEYV